jgi:hypothetical protein
MLLMSLYADCAHNASAEKSPPLATLCASNVEHAAHETRFVANADPSSMNAAANWGVGDNALETVSFMRQPRKRALIAAITGTICVNTGSM